MKLCLQSHLRSENVHAGGPEAQGSKMAGDICHRLTVSWGKPIPVPAIPAGCKPRIAAQKQSVRILVAAL